MPLLTIVFIDLLNLGDLGADSHYGVLGEWQHVGKSSEAYRSATPRPAFMSWLSWFWMTNEFGHILGCYLSHSDWVFFQNVANYLCSPSFVLDTTKTARRVTCS